MGENTKFLNVFLHFIRNYQVNENVNSLHVPGINDTCGQEFLEFNFGFKKIYNNIDNSFYTSNLIIEQRNKGIGSLVILATLCATVY